MRAALFLCLALAGCSAHLPVRATFPVVLPQAQVGKPVAKNLMKSPHRFRVSGELPPGLHLTKKAGYIWLVGVAKESGVYEFSIVSD